MPGHREQEQGWAGRRGELLAHAAPPRLREGALPQAWLLHVTRLAILIFLPPILEGIFWFFFCCFLPAQCFEAALPFQALFHVLVFRPACGQPRISDKAERVPAANGGFQGSFHSTG